MGKMKPNLAYEASFVRVRDDEPTPEELVQAADRRVRFKRIGIAVIVLVVVAIVAAAVLQLRRDTPAKQLARGKAYAAKNEHREAMLEFKRSIQGNPDQPAVRFLLANELSAVGDVVNAQIEYKRALDGGYPAEEVIVPLVRSALKQNDYATVVKLVTEANVDSPQTNAELQTMLGAAYLWQGKGQAGNDAFSAAREFVPGFKPAAVAEARYLLVTGKPELAENVIAKVSDDGRGDADLLWLRADLARLRHDLAKAEDFYTEAVKIDPRNMLLRLNLAQNALELNQLDTAEQQIRVVLQALPKNSKAQYIAASVAYAKKDLPTASTAIEASVQLSPKYGAAQLLAGVVARQTGDLLQAELHLREAVTIDPNNAEARRELTELYLQRHEPAKAAETFQPLLASQSTNPAIVSLAANIAMQNGDARFASQLFDRIAAAQSGDARATIVAASLKIAAGHEDLGFAQLAAAAKANPSNAEIDVAQIVARLQLHQSDAAMTAWRSLSAKQPSNARTDRLLAAIDAERKDMAGARVALNHALSIDPNDFLSIAALADFDFRDGHPDQAKARLQTYIAKAPQPTDALLVLARIEANGGAPDQTVTDLLDRAEKASPQAIQVARDQAMFYVGRNDTSKGASAIRRGLAIAPDDQQLLATRADLEQRTGQIDHALATLTRLVALNHEVPDYAMRLGLFQLRQGHAEAALASFRDVIKRNPAREDLQAVMMTSLLEANRLDEADRLLFDIGQAVPSSSALSVYSGDVKLAQKQFPEAIAAYRKALTTAPDVASAIKLSKALDAAKRREEATAAIGDWLKTHPADETALLYDAQRASVLPDYDRAANGYRKLLAVHPDDPRLLNNLAWVLGRKKDVSALDYANRANTLLPGDPDIGDTLAEILIQRGDNAEGLHLLEKVSAQVPQRADIKLRLARAQIGDGQKNSARQILQDLVKTSPDSAEGKQSKVLLTTLEN